MNRKSKSLMIFIGFALLSAGAAEAVNSSIPKPIPPNVTIQLSAEGPLEAGGSHPVRAQLMLGTNGLELVTRVTFRVVHGNAQFEPEQEYTNSGGSTVVKLNVPEPGPVVIEATCGGKNCRGTVTLEVAER